MKPTETQVEEMRERYLRPAVQALKQLTPLEAMMQAGLEIRWPAHWTIPANATISEIYAINLPTGEPQ